MEVLSIQYLRGCAALLVVFYHLELQLKRVGYEGYWPHFLSAGVDIFFVISGFIMWITTAKGMKPLEFFRRRIVRIVPLYWLLTSFVLAILVAFPNLVQSGRLEYLHVLGSYLFLPVVHPVEGFMQPLLIPGWTLNLEMFFYVIFGIALILPNMQRLIVVSTILVGLVATRLVISVAPLTAADFYTSDRILEFAFGMVLGWLYVRRTKFPAPVAWASFLLGASAIVLVGDSDMSRGLTIGIPALLLVAGAVMIERLNGMPNIPSLHLLGNASYSLYLSHTISLSTMSQFWRRLSFSEFSGASLLFGCIAVAWAITWGVVIYRWIELPISRHGHLQIFGSRGVSAQ